jgi:hypothetical protein
MADWYRNTDWNEAIETDFFERLSRSKSQRDQYLVLQAHHISESYPEVSLRLIQLYFTTKTDDFHDDRAHRVAANANFALGGHVAALDAYLAALPNADETEKKLYVGSPIEFAFLAARYRSGSHFASALTQLESVTLPDQTQVDRRFRYLSARALLLAETGQNPAVAKQDAAAALNLSEELKSACSDVVWRLRGIMRR